MSLNQFFHDINHYDEEFEEVSALMREFQYEIRPLLVRRVSFTRSSRTIHIKEVMLVI